MKRISLLCAVSLIALAGCNREMATSEVDEANAQSGGVSESVEAQPTQMPEPEVQETDRLADVLADARRADDNARDVFRNPSETLVFFEVEETDTIVEALPGGGWYTRVLAPYVSETGQYQAINYPMSLYEQLLPERLENPEFRARLEGWEDSFPAQVEAWGGSMSVGYRFGQVPEEAANSADKVLYIRALHNLTRFGQLDTAVSNAFTLLKPGGIVGVVQHRAPAGEADDRANGSRGYLREADVVAAFEAGGFVLEDSSDINANPNDTADYDRGVWMLPPTNGGDSDDEDILPLQSTGESDRMTLKFRKPT